MAATSQTLPANQSLELRTAPRAGGPATEPTFVPAITMRSLAEERRGRTLEWLMAQPLTESDVLLGKFVGGLKSPVQKLHSVLSSPLRSLAAVLKQVSEQKA